MKLRLLFALCLIFAAPAFAARHEIGDPPPDFALQTREGENVHLSDLRGKVVVLSFWASWCGPCRKELPIIDNLQRAAGVERLRVIAVNIEPSVSDFKRLSKALKDASLTLTHDRTGHIANAYGVKALPNMFMVGRDGKIAHVHLGYDESMLDTLVDEVNELLAAPEETQPAAAAAMP